MTEVYDLYDEYIYLDGHWERIGGGGSDVTVDDELSIISENPVQNKIITLAIQQAIQNMSHVEITENNQASETNYGCQIISINNEPYILSGSIYMEYTQNITADTDATFTFTNDIIKSTSAIDVWASIFGIVPKRMSIQNGVCTVVFNHDSSISLTCRIYIR